MSYRFHHILACLLTLAAVSLATLALARPAAAVEDPDIDYYTLETEHFYVHYYTGLEDFARRVATVQEEAYEILTPLLDWKPAGKTHIVVTDKADTANGAANVYGRNRVLVYSMPPAPESVLGYYDDWLRILIFHEYVHILHLDTATEEAPLVNYVIGKQLNPNQILPRWYIEGLATLYESQRTGTGRINSSLFRMWIRTAALEDQFFNLGTATGNPVEWPMGSAAYLYGSFFLDYVTRTRGQEFVRDFNHLYGSRIIPFSLNQTATEVGGETFQKMWNEFTAYTQAKALARRTAIVAQGRTELQMITSGGGENRFARPRPGHAQMSFHRADLESHEAFSLTSPDATDHHVVAETKAADGVHDWTPDGNTLIFGRRRVIDNVYNYSDIFALDVRNGQSRRLTDGERAREPSVSPDGKRLAYVRNLHGTMELVVRDMAGSAGDEPRILLGGSKWPADDDRHWQQISMPTWRPDGRALVFSWWRLDTRQRDLWLYDFDQPAGERLSRLTDDAAYDVEPYFADDGKLYFSSDRTGIYNAYVMDPASHETWQLSNVVNGVFSPRPSADGRWIYVSTYTAQGYEIARFRKPTSLWHRAPASYEAPVRRDYPDIDQSAWVTSRYRPWRWLAPLTFTPELSVLFSGTGLGGTLLGHDPIGHHSWRLSGLWTTGPQLTDHSSALSANYSYGALPFDVGLVGSFRTFPDTRSLVAENQYIPYSKSSYSGGVTAAYPIRSIDDNVSLSTSLQLQFTDFFDVPDIEHAPGDIEPRVPEHGWFSDLRFNLSYSDLEYYPQGISVTDGFSARVGLGLQHDLSDTDVNSVSLTYGFGAFVSVPFFEHHVLALQMNGGIIRSNFPGSVGFAIGGYSPQDVLTDIVLQQPRGQFVLRGYPPGFTRGDQYQVWSGEYRFPVHTFDQGFSTVPVFLRRIKGAVFSDVGAAYNGYLSDVDLLSSVGAEMQLDMTFGYFLGGALRLGYARGLDDGGINEWYLRYGGGF